MYIIPRSETNIKLIRIYAKVNYLQKADLRKRLYNENTIKITNFLYIKQKNHPINLRKRKLHRT